MGLFGNLFGRRTERAPSSAISVFALSLAGRSLCLNLKSAVGVDVVVYAVQNTNSMVPTFDANAVLLAEKVDFKLLVEGDIVTYRTAGKLIVHRLNERYGAGWWPLGDGNGRMDRVLVTPENFDRRVCGILYGAKDARTDH